MESFSDPSLSEDRFNPRPIATEEALSRQEDRIAYLRSLGHPWAEAVYQLRDMLVGFEDEEFWDGIPKEVRRSLADLDEREREKVRRQWAPEGWLGYPCRAIQGPNGPVFRPTNEDLSRAYRILRRLMDRAGFIRKTRRLSRLAPPRSDGMVGEVPGR